MADKKDNLRVLSPTEARKNGKKGGLQSGKNRKERKHLKQIITDYLSGDIEGDIVFEDIAKEFNITGVRTRKELFVIVCILNSLKKATLDDLEKLSNLLGENDIQENNGILNELAIYLSQEKEG